MYAIVSTGGKQYKVEPGKYFKAEKVNANVGDTVELDCLLVCDDNGKITTGTPVVSGVKAKAEVLEQGKEDKIVVFKNTVTNTRAGDSTRRKRTSASAKVIVNHTQS